MCDDIFGGGGGGGGTTSTSTASNSTDVNVSVPISVDTTKVGEALQALATTQLVGATANARATVQAAQIAAVSSGPSTTEIVIAIATVVGLLFTIGFFKLPRDLRA